MKFTLNNDHQTNRFMNLLLKGLMLFIVFFLSTDLFVKKEYYGSTPYQIKTTLHGNEDEFIEPLPLSSLLESVHADIFFAMMSILMLGAIYGRVANNKKMAAILINIMMLSAFIAVVAPLLAYFYSDMWIYFWMAASVLWHITAIVISFLSLWRLQFP